MARGVQDLEWEPVEAEPEPVEGEQVREAVGKRGWVVVAPLLSLFLL